MLIVSPNICIYDCVYSESLLSSKNNSTAYWTLVDEYQNYIKHTMSKAKCLVFHSSFFLPKCFSLSSLFHFSFFIALCSIILNSKSWTHSCVYSSPILYTTSQSFAFFFKPILLYLSITNLSPQLLILGSTARNNLLKHIQIIFTSSKTCKDLALPEE